MDFKKVLDQTVREIKREVNKTILKVPEIEQKVLDATSNEPWGPHGTVMAEIAQATRNYYELQMVMAVLWKRLSDTGRNWRHVYKALTLLEYLVAHGSEKVIDDIKEHGYQISTLADFQFVEPNGKDQGINVQKKSQNLILLVNDKEKIREVRQKAAENRDKYRGLSSSGVMSKPSSYQSTGGSYGGDRYEEDNYSRHTNDRYSRDRDADRYRSDDRNGDRSSWHSDQHRDRHNKSYDEDVDNHGDHQSSSDRRRTEAAPTVTSTPLGYDEASQSPDSHAAGDQSEWKPFADHSVSASSAKIISDDFDDFNPRATSGAAPTTSQFDVLFNQSEPSAAVKTSTSLGSSSSLGETSDLFGETLSSSVMPVPPLNTVQNLGKNLFGNSPSKVEAYESTSSTAVHAAIKPPPSYTPPTGNASVLSRSGTFITPPPTFFPGNVVATGGVAVNTFVPAASSVNQTASIPFGGDDFFGLDVLSFSGAVSSAASQAAHPLNAPAPPAPSMAGASQTSQASSTSLFNPTQPFVGTTGQGQSGNTRPQQQKRFETKSSVWADSLSKGLIDLNIAGPKSNPLTDIGIDFDQLRPERIKDEKMSTTKSLTGMGKAMGSGSGLGVAGAGAIAPAAMPMALNNIRMAPAMGMGMSTSMGMGAGMGSMMSMDLNPGVAVRSGAGMGSAPELGIGISKSSGMGGFSNQQQQYGGFR